jgi:hypothetical protein
MKGPLAFMNSAILPRVLPATEFSFGSETFFFFAGFFFFF